MLGPLPSELLGPQMWRQEIVCPGWDGPGEPVSRACSRSIPITRVWGPERTGLWGTLSLWSDPSVQAPQQGMYCLWGEENVYPPGPLRTSGVWRSPGTGEGDDPVPSPLQAEKAGEGDEGFPVGTSAG